MLGAWKLVDMEPCALPEDVATGFAKATHVHGSEYIPVLYCGQQVVSGTNHMLICKQTVIVQHPIEHLVKVIIWEPLTIEGEHDWKLLSIDNII